MWKPLIGILGLAAATACAGPAGGAVTVIGSTLARACSVAAFSGETARKYEDMCTMALDGEMLNQRDRAGTFVNRGVLRMRRSEFDSAIADFNRAVSMKGDLGQAFVNRGAAAVGQHRYRDGLDDLNKALELGVDEPEKAYYNRALAYEGLDDLKAAYFDYQKAAELKPEWEAPKKELARFSVHRP
jgi:tetratricopeptide (TPR) repeat protein